MESDQAILLLLNQMAQDMRTIRELLEHARDEPLRQMERGRRAGEAVQRATDQMQRPSGP